MPKITMEIELDCNHKFKTKEEFWEFCRGVLIGKESELQLFSERIPLYVGRVRGISVKLPPVKRS